MTGINRNKEAAQINNKEFAMALSGGGYRASLFSLGSLWRLNEFGLLAQMDRITSVSGGSITSAYLAMNWKDLYFNKDTHISPRFREVIAEPLQNFCSKGLDVIAVLSGLISPWKSIGDRVAELYAKRLFGTKTMQDIPAMGEGPEFIFYATSLQTGSSVRISKSSISDYKIGTWPTPELPLAKVVGISSAFPPILSPVSIKCSPDEWKKTPGAYLYDDVEYRKNLVLTDGGVYDNLGLEAVWNDGFKNVFVCDASAPFKFIKAPGGNWLSQALRVTDIITYQTRALRRRALIADYQDLDEKGSRLKYGGAFLGIKTRIDTYDLADAMVKDNALTASLQKIRTRLNAFSKEEQGHLINWGYALTDTALRKYYFTAPLQPGRWPVPEYALDS
jgi:NTE family protein